MPNQVTPTDIGRRVTLQFILPNGHASEVVGKLEYFDDDAKTFMVRDRHGELTRVPLRDIKHGRIVS